MKSRAPHSTRRRRRARLLAGLPLFGAIVLHAAAQAGSPKPAPVTRAPEPVDFNRDIRPILATNCLSCHGQDAGTRQANLRLDTRDGAIAQRKGQRAIEPGKPEQSSVVARINATNALQMPPASTGHRLTAEQKRLLTRWIREGAPYAAHWAFTPVRQPAVPPSRLPARNPIHAFVLARLEKAGLKPAPEADRFTLIRRLSLDLTGLPPSAAEVAAFVEDRSPDAYEKAVDRLLASPRYGEHWARTWLDLARYADTQGYEKDLGRTIWRYRDWVIDAFNRDMPYDQFTVEQLAGDLLYTPANGKPGVTRPHWVTSSPASALLATAFHRNTMTNTEGGTDPEEFRVAAVKDRVDTTGQVWMGLTFGCAKCHSHKYDPITMSEYYRFYALFNQTEDANRGNEFPTVPTPTEEQQSRLAALEDRVKGLREAFSRPIPDLTARQEAWERGLAGTALWTPAGYDTASASSGATFGKRTDGAILVSGKHEERDTYTITLPLPEGGVRSLRLEALKDPSLPKGGPGREANDQNAVTSELSVELLTADGKRSPVKLVNPRADFEQGGWPVANAIDGKPDTGWAWAPQSGQPHVAVFDFERSLAAPGGKLVVTLTQNFPRLSLGCFRLSLSSAEPALLKPELRTLSEVAAVPRTQRTPAEQMQLDGGFRQTTEPTASIYRDLSAVEAELAAVRKEIPTTPIMRDLPADRQRVTRMHQRGNFLDPGETVTPAVPGAFGPFPDGAPLNRLGAALWIVSPENPLTARVAVNRVWARLFGTGLVETEEDFGTQGTAPSHPELLDYLASRFVSGDGERGGLSGGKGDRENGSGKLQTLFHSPTPPLSHSSAKPWSIKSLIRTIVTSATYRQSGVATAEKVKVDPANALLSRGPRFRLGAEVIRDQALAVSGLLSAKLHGPSVMPPQPDGIWKAVYSGLKWQTSPGEDRYRRALYTFWRRSSPYPSLTTFDAGSGEFCVVRRVRTNTPLQALVTLNDPAFVEAAGALGRAMCEASYPGALERLALGARRVLIRQPAAAELGRLERLLETTLADLRAKPESAKALLAAANQSPLPGRDPVEQAAYVVVANVLLNLDEALTKP